MFCFLQLVIEPCGRTAEKNQSAQKWPYFTPFPRERKCRGRKKQKQKQNLKNGSKWVYFDIILVLMTNSFFLFFFPSPFSALYLSNKPSYRIIVNVGIPKRLNAHRFPDLWDRGSICFYIFFINVPFDNLLERFYVYMYFYIYVIVRVVFPCCFVSFTFRLPKKQKKKLINYFIIYC